MMIRAIAAITNAATTKIPISSALDSPPPVEELLVAGATVTGPVALAVGVCVVDVAGISEVAGLVAPTAAAPAGSSSNANKTAAAAARSRCPACLPLTIAACHKIAAI
jgi:hypothetical protein